jgi:toxin-antitoxin system PIN domain toxin
LIGLLDVNVLLALAWPHHPHHAAAHRWFAQYGNNGWATCLFTQSAFLRLSLNRHVVSMAVDCPAAVTLLEQLLTHPHHHYIDATPGLTAAPFLDLAHRIVGHRQVTDATLLYIARSHGLKFITFDQAVIPLCPWPQHVEICPTP